MWKFLAPRKSRWIILYWRWKVCIKLTSSGQRKKNSGGLLDSSDKGLVMDKELCPEELAYFLDDGLEDGAKDYPDRER